jgi:Sec1 family
VLWPNYFFINALSCSGTVAKHVQLVGELSRLVTAQNLLEISELEQNIVSGGIEHNQCLEALKKLLADPRTTDLVSFTPFLSVELPANTVCLISRMPYAFLCSTRSGSRRMPISV